MPLASVPRRSLGLGVNAVTAIRDASSAETPNLRTHAAFTARIRSVVGSNRQRESKVEERS